MKVIRIADATLCAKAAAGRVVPGFRERIEIVKALDRLCADAVELECAAQNKADLLLLQTAAPLVQNSVLCCRVPWDAEAISAVWEAIRGAKQPRLQLCVPTSTVQVEYVLGCKQRVLLEQIPDRIAQAKALCNDVEFSAGDATRSEPEFLAAALQAAICAGATGITVCDTAGLLLPQEFAAFLTDLYARVPELKTVRLGVECSKKMHMSTACSIAAVGVGAELIKTAVGSESLPSLTAVADVIRLRSGDLKLETALNLSVLEQTCTRIHDILFTKQSENSPFTSGVRPAPQEKIVLQKGDSQETVLTCVRQLGYTLSEEDKARVYENVCRVTRKKTIGAKELDAIVASAAMQAMPTYRLHSFVTNSSNVMSASAQVELEHDGALLQGISLGDGPIDAAFLAIEKILGHHFELDDFQIQSVTEGREAMGEAIVKLRANGKLYAGRGISTDIIGASVHAYLNALNKICYEEGQG